MFIIILYNSESKSSKYCLFSSATIVIIILSDPCSVDQFGWIPAVSSALLDRPVIKVLTIKVHCPDT